MKRIDRTKLVLLLSTVLFLTACSKRTEPPKIATPAAAVAETKPTPPRMKSGGEMTRIEGGTFVMGEKDGRSDAPAHEVTIGTFLMDKYPVTQAQYKALMQDNPSKGTLPTAPVERTTWVQAAEFCNKASKLDGLTPCYDPKTWACNFEADGYRLPTEAEWEYACRAGSTTKFFFGDDENKLSTFAWTRLNASGQARPVGEKLPSKWGLYDMHGNVFEWCNDWYSTDYYGQSPATDPRGPVTGEMRVLRGGAWDSKPKKCTSAYRNKAPPSDSNICFGTDYFGFRRVRNAN